MRATSCSSIPPEVTLRFGLAPLLSGICDKIFLLLFYRGPFCLPIFMRGFKKISERAVIGFLGLCCCCAFVIFPGNLQQLLSCLLAFLSIVGIDKLLEEFGAYLFVLFFIFGNNG